MSRTLSAEPIQMHPYPMQGRINAILPRIRYRTTVIFLRNAKIVAFRNSPLRISYFCKFAQKGEKFLKSQVFEMPLIWLPKLDQKIKLWENAVEMMSCLERFFVSKLI